LEKLRLSLLFQDKLSEFFAGIPISMNFIVFSQTDFQTRKDKNFALFPWSTIFIVRKAKEEGKRCMTFFVIVLKLLPCIVAIDS